jgi:hypothetical protein
LRVHLQLGLGHKATSDRGRAHNWPFCATSSGGLAIDEKRIVSVL